MRMPRGITSIKGLFLLAVIILMVFSNHGFAAEQEEADKNNEAIEEKKIAGSDEAKEDEAVDKGYVYNPTGKTDPFLSFIAIAEEREEDKPKTYLETLELSQLDLAVIVIGPKEKWAMVTDSKDVGHVIKEGTLIGTNGGVVYKILEGEVIIREEYRDFRGNQQYREISKKSPSTK